MAQARATIFFPAPERAPARIQVEGKQQVKEVLTDVQDRYSVCGYVPRMEASLGLIYLGMDRADPRYALQSAASNAAIHAISQYDAFTEALAATRRALQKVRGRHVDVKDLSDEVLADLCTLWFDLPDGDHVIASGSVLPGLRGHCPGHYGPVSGSIFQPEPGILVRYAGRLAGRWLRVNVLKFVQDVRENRKTLQGALSRALFAAFPARAQDELLASTIIGVMMGFLPTAQGNMLSVFSAWNQERRQALWQLLNAEPEKDFWQRAKAHLERPMVEAMQAKPMPPAIWRTATEDHVFAGQEVKKGDILHVNLDSATREDLAAGNADVTPIFGGDRDASPHPTHACPGLWMGMGVLLGFTTGVIEESNRIASVSARPATALN